MASSLLLAGCITLPSNPADAPFDPGLGTETLTPRPVNRTDLARTPCGREAFGGSFCVDGDLRRFSQANGCPAAKEERRAPECVPAAFVRNESIGDLQLYGTFDSIQVKSATSIRIQAHAATVDVKAWGNGGSDVTFSGSAGALRAEGTMVHVWGTLGDARLKADGHGGSAVEVLGEAAHGAQWDLDGVYVRLAAPATCGFTLALTGSLQGVTDGRNIAHDNATHWSFPGDGTCKATIKAEARFFGLQEPPAAFRTRTTTLARVPGADLARIPCAPDVTMGSGWCVDEDLREFAVANACPAAKEGFGKPYCVPLSYVNDDEHAGILQLYGSFESITITEATLVRIQANALEVDVTAWGNGGSTVTYAGAAVHMTASGTDVYLRGIFGELDVEASGHGGSAIHITGDAVNGSFWKLASEDLVLNAPATCGFELMLSGDMQRLTDDRHVVHESKDKWSHAAEGCSATIHADLRFLHLKPVAGPVSG